MMLIEESYHERANPPRHAHAEMAPENRQPGDGKHRAGRDALTVAQCRPSEDLQRAVLNPRCHPFKLPADKYDRWRTMTLIFNPRDMVGT